MAGPVFLVLDGLPPESATPDVMPALCAWCEDSATVPHTVPAVLPATTYPNHATFVTGVEPAVHGIVGNHVRGDDRRFHPAREIGPAVPTIFDDLAAAGRSSTVVVSDQDLVGVMGARAASSHWPPDGAVPEGAATDAHGYLDDDVTLPHVLDAISGDADLVFAHLNAPDTAGHVDGPGSAEAVYRATDARVGVIRAHVEATRPDALVMIVSDHAMEAITDPAPVDLTPVLLGTRLAWCPEGSAALVYGDDADVLARLGAHPGVGGVQPLAPGVHLVWGDEGRWICVEGIEGEPGTHGSPRSARQLAAVVGRAPAVAALDGRIAAGGFDATSWRGELARALGIA
jgi:hypothetical protein